MAERSPRDPRDPLDEEAAWAEIVAGYGEQPSFPAGDGDGGDGEAGASGSAAKDAADAADGKPEAAAPSEAAGKDGTGDGSGTGDAARPGSFVVFAPGVGPRDWSAAKASDDDFDETDEGHFTPPEPPPLPKADVTTKFAWLAVVGGPLLLVAMVLLQQPVTWWITVLGIGGFLGGFATLVARMKDDDEDDNDLPGSGAVV
ncbi:hypothetical protein [Streptomyces nigrescens]|uniref:hypothetical protein n=1 Tax=Streptomyces nigrescens TaxID=1920 RepID=UPI00225263BE|nr:hypothetical protein [Streptomyces libani]MCX5450907.1 hypothetical protein [Streptomyces libani]